jgi:ABC-type phosphate transport system substrate-binding protein
MKTKHLVITIIAAALPIAGLLAEDTANQPAAPKEEQQSNSTSKNQMMCKGSSQQNAELDQLVAAMNSATPDKKVDAIAAVVAKLVEQQKAAGTQCEKMSAEGNSCMNMCQMMAGMDMKNGEHDKNGDEHSHHH